MNGHTKLVLFVEGPDDSRFAERVLFPLAERMFNHIQLYEYAERKPSKVREYISQIKFVPDWDYIFTADFDEGPCITLRKSRLMDQYDSLDDPKRILIVRREIESWYLAGLNSDSCAHLGIPNFPDTNDILKEQFDGIIPQRFDSRTDFLVETLKRYDTATARRKNASFDYAMEKPFAPIA